MLIWKVIDAYYSEELKTDAALLECPHRKCHGRTLVDRQMFKEGRIDPARIIGRPCPYCFSTSELPLTAPRRSR